MYSRFLSREVAVALEDTPVLLITGARQTGKSTFCKQLQKEGIFDGESVTMDDPATLVAAQEDSIGFLMDLGKHVIIDEIQRVPKLLLSLKKLIDEDREGRRVILTGSSDVMLQPKVADSLAGRLEVFSLWPLSLAEIRGQSSYFLDKLVLNKGKFHSGEDVWEQLISFIRRGGYPEVVKRKNQKRRTRWLQSYLTSILQKDIRDLANIDGLTKLPGILALLSVRVGSTVNMSDISRLAGVKNTSFQRYMALLEQVFLIVKIPAWTPNAEGRYVKSPKILFNDTGLLCHLDGNGADLLEDRTKAGRFLENFVIMEIIKQISWFDSFLKPLHFSMHKGAEVDLILEDAHKRIYGIEIKSKASLNKKDFKGLKKLAEVAGEKFQKGILLYTGNKVLGGFGGKDLQAVPIENLWSGDSQKEKQL